MRASSRISAISAGDLTMRWRMAAGGDVDGGGGGKERLQALGLRERQVVGLDPEARPVPVSDRTARQKLSRRQSV